MNRPGPLQTEEQHQAALKEVEALWNAKPGTPEEERLDQLVDLIVAFEKVHYPMGEEDGA
jgi:HTH-type transcriptional regulator / antitoxin HigA